MTGYFSSSGPFLLLSVTIYLWIYGLKAGTICISCPIQIYIFTYTAILYVCAYFELSILPFQALQLY